MSVSGVTNVVLAGVGGQGILLASEIVAQAAMAAGHQVKTNEVHGMAQRGGSVIAQVRFGPEVHSPLIAEGTAHVLGSFEQIEAIRFAHYLAPGGLAVVSKQAIIPVTASSGGAVYPQDTEQRLRQLFPRLRYLDAAQLATDLGNVRTANVIILGVVSTGMSLPLSAWHEALAACVPPKHRDINLKAFETGRGLP
jgi:indolepyruvate ferredoxin oxidoreductase, beta subunit